VWNLCIEIYSLNKGVTPDMPVTRSEKHIANIRSGAVGWGTVLQTRMSQVQFPIVSMEFFIDVILPALLLPWGGQPVTEMSTRNISWEVNAAGALG
jgi:hypothetical protein